MLSEELRNIAIWVRSRRRTDLMLASALDELAEQAEMLECTRLTSEERAERVAVEGVGR